jgi:hypothetical protein
VLAELLPPSLGSTFPRKGGPGFGARCPSPGSELVGSESKAPRGVEPTCWKREDACTIPIASPSGRCGERHDLRARSIPRGPRRIRATDPRWSRSGFTAPHWPTRLTRAFGWDDERHDPPACRTSIALLKPIARSLRFLRGLARARFQCSTCWVTKPSASFAMRPCMPFWRSLSHRAQGVTCSTWQSS